LCSRIPVAVELACGHLHCRKCLLPKNDCVPLYLMCRDCYEVTPTDVATVPQLESSTKVNIRRDRIRKELARIQLIRKRGEELFDEAEKLREKVLEAFYNLLSRSTKPDDQLSLTDALHLMETTLNELEDWSRRAVAVKDPHDKTIDELCRSGVDLIKRASELSEKYQREVNVQPYVPTTSYFQVGLH
uniref:RING-type domain-containing protein n=1 Tax=Mesocestoides corti TaxID=53468 RepID=A0A5K3FGD1_MESCO